MAKKRRKVDKIHAQKLLKKKIIKQEVSTESTSKAEKELKVKKEKLATLFNYDPSLIAKDLKKTLLITLVVLLVLALIALRYT